jgi:ribosome biogenesis GTPase A
MSINIQWFPGHMHKAAKEVKEALPATHIFIEILDARIPFSSQNPMLADIRKDKPCIKVLNKSDLADPESTAIWQEYLEREQGVKTLVMSSVEHPERIKLLPDICRQMLPDKDQSIKNINAMIMGIPNVGKSTIINTWSGRTIAKTGNEPAVTKTQQRINLDNGIVLFDTPGMLWPNLENRNSGYRLGTTGAIKDTAIEYEDVAFFAADYLLKTYPDRLKQRYKLDILPATELEFLEIIGRQRGCLSKGGHIDLNRISKILLTELRDGLLGGITLELPAMMEIELIELEVIRAAKAEKEKARLQNRKKRKR